MKRWRYDEALPNLLRSTNMNSDKFLILDHFVEPLALNMTNIVPMGGQ